MPEWNIQQLLDEAVTEVLETMFFATPLGPAEPQSGAPVLDARLVFQGHPSGALNVCFSTASAKSLAAGFLGEEEDALTDAQPGEVVCEFANMLCGSLVSKLEDDEQFDLSSPELALSEPVAGASPENLIMARQSYELDNGILTVTLHLEAIA